MPIRYAPGGDHHERDEYSFYTRDHGSRDFARFRRFGGEHAEEGRTMSLVSTPLQVPLIGKGRNASPSQGRGYSPQQPTYEDEEEEFQEGLRALKQKRGRSVENRRRYEQDFDDYETLEPLVPTYQPRVGRYQYRETRHESSSPRRSTRRTQMQQPHYEDEYDEDEAIRRQRHQEQAHHDREPEVEEHRQQLPSRQQRQDDELRSILNWRKRSKDPPLVHTDFGYVIPPMRKRTDPGLQDDEDNYRSVVGYIAKRRQFAVEDDDDMQYYKNPNYQYRTHGMERPLVTDKDVEESMERNKLDRAPMFDMKIRSHVVWEKMRVKFTCTVRGSPTPRVTWYKDMVPLEPSLCTPGKYKISNNFGLHSLEISRASIEDSGTYRVSMQNRKGEISSYATLLVRRYDGGRTGIVDMKSGYNLKKPSDYPDVEGLNVPGYPRFVTPLYAKTVQEGEAMIITCEVDGSPAPEVFWTLNGRHIDESSSHIQQTFDGKQATLTVLKVFTDDEGEYCCRAFNSCGAATSRCYVRVLGVDAPPSAPSCVEVSEATRDYIMLSWKAPGYIGHFGGAPVDGYIIETAEAGSSIWKPWNKKPVKLTKAPISGLGEGRVYFFRVKAVSRWGPSPSSLPSSAVAVRDAGSPRLPQELEDPSSLLPPETEDISVEEEDEEENQLPGIPAKVTVTQLSEGNVNVAWEAPDTEESQVPVDGYIIESCEVGTEDWMTVTSEPLQTNDPYPVTGLSPGKRYRFRVFSVNYAGCSEPSELSTAVQMSGSKDISQQMLTDVKVEDIEDITQSEDCRNSCDNVEQCSNKLQEEMELCATAQHDDAAYEMITDLEKLVPKKAERSKLPSPPVDVKELKVTREFIVVGWTPPFKTGGQDPVYYVEMKKVGCEDWKICNQAPISLTHYPITGVEEGQSYIFRVRAVTNHGTSQFSTPSEPMVASDNMKPPNWWGGVQGIFRVANEKGIPCITKDSIKVCWDAPTTDGGATVNGYYLEYRPAGGKFKPVNNKPLNQRHFNVEGLTTGIEYEFRVRACNMVGCGTWKMLPGRVMAKNPDPPAYPTDLLLTAVGEESVMLKWKEPMIKGDALMVGYVVERCKEGTDIWIPCNKMPEDIKDEKFKVDGLVRGQTYFFRVRAVNKVGAGEPSLMSCFVAPGEEWVTVEDRQNSVLEMRRKKKEEELARQRALEEEERKQAFVTGIEDCRTISRGRAYFECTVKDPTTIVKWCLGNDQEMTLEPAGKYDIVHVGNRRSLAISDCQHSDVQLIHCIALYNGCTTSADCIVDGLVPVVFIERPTDLYVRKGEAAIFTCTLTRAEAEVTWFKNGAKIDEADDRYEIISSGNGRSLIFKNAEVKDAASYTVAGFGGSLTAHLVVDGVLPAHFTSAIHGGDYGHDEGEAEFECVISPSSLYNDDEEPECLWYHNGERVEEGDDKYLMTKKGNKRILKIINLNHEDSGVVVSRCGGDETRCEIDVERPPPPPPKVPVLQAEDNAINFLQGLRSEPLPGSIRLFCVVVSLRQDVTIYWYKDNVEIDTNSKEFSCIIDRGTGLVSLIFNRPMPGVDEATYTCEFITTHSTFDTKVNFNFGEGEYESVIGAATKMREEEEREKQQRIEERKRKRAELKNRREEAAKSQQVATPVIKEENQQEDPVEMSSDGITYGVDGEGNLVLGAEVAELDNNAAIVWLKDGVPVESDRFRAATANDTVELIIMRPQEQDAGTYTCKVKTKTNPTEMNTDITGKVFSDLLAKSEAIRHLSTTEVDGVQDCLNDVDYDAVLQFDDVTQLCDEVSPPDEALKMDSEDSTVSFSQNDEAAEKGENLVEQQREDSERDAS